MSNPYDLVIIGGGVAGMTAGVYAARNRLRTVILEKAVVGGQPAVAEKIENFPGYPDLNGLELSTRLERHVQALGVPVIEPEEVRGMDAERNLWRLHGSQGTYLSRAVIVASGGRPRFLNVPGEKRFSRKGVHYCAQCAGFGYEGKRIAVVGGGESGLVGALLLAEIGEQVTVIHRRDTFRSERMLEERVFNTRNISRIQGAVVEEILGDHRVRAIRIRDLNTSESSEIELDAVFVSIGYLPNTSFVDADKDENGFLRVNMEMRTSVPGIFACGNVIRENAQIVSSMGEAAVAVLSATRYIVENPLNP